MRRVVEERAVVPARAVLVVVAEPLSENVENVEFQKNINLFLIESYYFTKKMTASRIFGKFFFYFSIYFSGNF